MPKPLISDQPYPSLEQLSCDPVSARIISPAYATPAGELNAILQYELHSVNFAVCGDGGVAETLESIAKAEMLHLKLLSEALLRLGAQPVYSAVPPAQFNFYSTKFVASSRSMKNMVEDDIMGEKYAIYCYERMLLRLKNDVLKRLVCRIIEDERIHLDTLNDLLTRFSCQ